MTLYPKIQSSLRLGVIRAVAWLCLLETLAFSLQSCSQSELAGDCDRLQKSLYTAPNYRVLNALQLDQAAAIDASKQQAILAQKIAQMQIDDETLSAYRSNLVDLYLHDSDLGLQVASFMTAAGDISVAGSNRTAYDQVASQRIMISQQVQDQHNMIAGHCSTP